MPDNYYIKVHQAKAGEQTAVDRLNSIERLVSTAAAQLPAEKEGAGRNLWTRMLDWFLVAGRHYVPPLFWFGAGVSAFIIFLYARLVALTLRLITSGHFRWPNIRAPFVLALWHGDAPSFLAAFAAQRPSVELVILIAPDPRGDFLTLLCRMLGLKVVRGGSEEGGWEALVDLAYEIEQGLCAVITADGGGPAHTVKVGALALASATHVPLLPLSANCYPAIVERRKWDEAHNPVPFAKVAVVLGEPRTIASLSDFETIQQNCQYLQSTLEELGAETRRILAQ